MVGRFFSPEELTCQNRRQTSTLGFQLSNQNGVVFLYKLVEQSMLWAMAFIGDVTKGMTVNRGRPSIARWQHAASTSTFADLARRPLSARFA
jgi:hypothetical protein